MGDYVIPLSGLAIILAFFYWLNRTYVTKEECKSRQDCIEAKLDGLKQVVMAKLRHIEKLITGDPCERDGSEDDQ